ncbi:negative elongation factor a-like [Gigaspora margarita]|uniref:Negative elongation factor a-like n=1 Tax=Gigaspora margarita TaxID=4874 RepID=A0A8H3XF36_GIGMA|nr:negative elongation factor a-like [Gigaspora margarita]
MALDRGTPEGVEAWLIEMSAKPWSFPTAVGPELSQEILQHICNRWDTYTPNIKLGVLFAILSIRKLLVSQMKDELSAIIEKGIREEEDEWVVLISKMLREYPSTAALDLNIERHIPIAAQKGLQNLMNKIRLNGIKFHPVEYAFIDRDICDSFSTLSLNSSVTSSHFVLRDSNANSANQIRSMILNNMSVPPSPSLTSPVNVSGFNFPPVGQPQNQALHGPPSRSNSISSGQSLFIPSKRRPSYLTQPNFKAGSLPGAGSSSQGLESPTEQKVTITQGKKYQKPSRIQMIDISTGSKIIKDQEESKRQTQLEEQQSKEARRLEREKKQEERRREEEEKRLQKEQEKAERAEKQRLKEEAKRRKSEKKTTTKTATAAETETTDASVNNYSLTRKKKRLNSDEVIEEETISDGEMSHKNPQTIVASPTSLSPPANQFNDQNIDSSTTNDNIVPEISTVAEPLGQPVTSDVTPSEQPSQQFEEQPRRNMTQTERSLFERNCVAVLTEANKVNDNADLRQIIINFLGGVHETKQLKAASVGIHNSDDNVRQIILHEETARNHDGKATTETLIFEINLTNGQWRKLKRKKVKGLRNQTNDGSNSRMNGRQQNGET